MMTFFMRMCIKKTAVGTTQRVNHEGHAVYVMYKENGCAVSLVSDMEYPQRVAISILSRVMSEFTAMVAFNDWNSAMRDNTIVFPMLQESLTSYQDPGTDKIVAMQRDLDETKGILIKAIGEVIVTVTVLSTVALTAVLAAALAIFFRRWALIGALTGARKGGEDRRPGAKVERPVDPIQEVPSHGKKAQPMLHHLMRFQASACQSIKVKG